MTQQNWEEEWAEFCKKQAHKFNKFSELQRTGIAVVFKIEGKYFISNLIHLNRKELVEEILADIPDEFEFEKDLPPIDGKLLKAQIRERYL